jgi:vitamin B12 transporter
MKQLSVILATIGASSACMGAYAQTGGEPVDQIIVTGSRSPLSISSMGNSVTVISQDDIQRRKARYVSDLLRTVPGFSVSQSGGAGSQTQVRVRGAEANHVLVMIDGIRANDPATGDEFRWEFLTTANIERIEIVRGPQSALWGSDAVAGVVHVITRSGSGKPSIGGYVEGGSNDTMNSSLQGGLGDDNWNLDFAVENLSTDGINFSRAGGENDDSDATTLSLNGSAQVSEALTLSFGARSVDAYSQYDNIDYFLTGLPADSNVALDTQQNYYQVGGTIGNNAQRVRHHLAIRYFDSSNRNLTDDIEDITALSDRYTYAYQADISLGDNVLSLALEQENTSFEQRGPIVYGDPNQEQDMDTTSVIADYQAHLGDSITWLASARFDNNSVFDDAITGRLSLSWSLSDATRLRGNVGTGQKNPTFIEMFGYFPGQFVSNPALQPEESTSFDIGIEQHVSDTLSFQLTAFHQDLENEINGFAYNPDTYEVTAENMQGTSKRDGVELSAHWSMSENFGLNASYTYVDSSAENVREIRRPRHSGSVDIDYGFLDGRGRMVLAADYGGTRTDTFYPPWPELPTIVTMSNHWLLDLTVQYQLSANVSLFARGTNLLDTEYEHVVGYATPGRSGFAGLQVDFGR